jgi:hypothetical protein
MEIKRCGSRPSVKRPAENFTGSVRIDSLFDPPDPARTFGAMVTVRAGCGHGVAYPSARADANNHFWIRLDTMLGRTQHRDDREVPIEDVAGLATRLPFQRPPAFRAASQSSPLRGCAEQRS